MPLWKDGRFVDDDWRIVVDDEPLPEAAPAIVSLKRWREQRGELQGRNAPLGLLIAPGSDWSDVAGELQRFPVIVVTIAFANTSRRRAARRAPSAMRIPISWVRCATV